MIDHADMAMELLEVHGSPVTVDGLTEAITGIYRVSEQESELSGYTMSSGMEFIDCLKMYRPSLQAGTRVTVHDQHYSVNSTRIASPAMIRVYLTPDQEGNDA